MIQIYNPNNINFEHNGDMTLMPSSAPVHAILNGAWSASLDHPIDQDGRWKYIREGAVVKMPSFLDDDQLYRIKNVQKSDSGVSAKMEPIFYDSMDDCFLVDVRPTNDNGQQALDLMTAPNNKYTGESDISTVSTAYYQYKNLMEAINGDNDNSFINRWGGEILFDNYTVIINGQVGGDYGVEIRYGKNLPSNGLSEEVDVQDVVTRIYPKSYNGYEMSNHGFVDSPLINDYPTVKARTITFDNVKMVEDAQDNDAENGVIICNNQAELNAALTQRCNEQYALGLDKPKVSIKANMVLLKNTEQYKDYAVLENVSLGDTIHCIHSRLGIISDVRVIELTYDSILKTVTSVTLGDYQYNYFQNVSSSVNRVNEAIRSDGTVIAEQIAGFIDGAMASLKAQYDVAQNQDVLAILFENLDEDSPLFGALGIGTQGIMISRTRTSDGRDWNWTTAITFAGIIANTIIAGIISDKLGRNTWNLDTGEFVSARGQIAGWNINSQSLYKDVTAPDGTIYRVYFQPPLQDNTDRTWILSCQKSTDGGDAFYGTFILYADGSAHFGNNNGNYIFINEENVQIVRDNTAMGGFTIRSDGNCYGEARLFISNIGANGSFTTADGKTVTVQYGVITGIS